MSDDMFLYDDEDEDMQANRFLTFSLADEVFAVGIQHVIEIVEIQRISEVPDLPPYVKGVINLRGSIIPVVDMRIRFSLPERTYDDRTCMVIVTTRDIRIGLIVDTVHETVSILPADIAAPPKFRDTADRRFISGIGHRGERVEIIIDVGKVLYGEAAAEVAQAVEQNTAARERR